MCARLQGNLVGGVMGCQVSNYSTAVSSSLFARKIIIFGLSQRDTATAYDEDHAYFIVGEILGALKKGNDSNHHRSRHRARSSLVAQPP